MTKKTLLLVDNDRRLLESVADWLREQGLGVDAAWEYAEALDALRQKTYDLVIADGSVARGDELDMLEQLQRLRPDVPVILMAGNGNPDVAVEALRAGAADYVTKPLMADELLMTIERTLNQQNVKEENSQLRRELDRHYTRHNIIGQDPRMLRVFEMVDSVADTRATVLITGESGTGKSMIARALHRRSGRSTKPFIEVACGALCRRTCWRASSSATLLVRSPAQRVTRSASSSRPTGGRSSSTRSAPPAPRCR